MIKLLKREPAAVGFSASTLAVLAAMFGLELTPEQAAAILAVVNLIIGIVVRSRVTPV